MTLTAWFGLFFGLSFGFSFLAMMVLQGGSLLGPSPGERVAEQGDFGVVAAIVLACLMCVSWVAMCVVGVMYLIT